MSEIEELKHRITQLEKEINSLQKVSIFSDIQPVLDGNVISKYKTVKIRTIDLSYRVRIDKKRILTLLHQRIAQDLYKQVEDLQLLNPKNGSLLKGDEDLKEFEDDEGVILLDFQYTATSCDHHDHDSDDFSDDENFYNSCSCSHQH